MAKHSRRSEPVYTRTPIKAECGVCVIKPGKRRWIPVPHADGFPPRSPFPVPRSPFPRE